MQFCISVCSPSCLGIIRIGPKIRKPEWIEQDDWNYLNSSIEYPHCNLSSETENLFTTLLNTVSTIYHCFQRNENVIYIGFFFYSSITEFVK